MPWTAARARRPRPAHHEPGASEPEVVRAGVPSAHRWRDERDKYIFFRRQTQQRQWQRRKHEEGKKASKADNLKAQRRARKDFLKRKKELSKRKKERDRRKRSVASANAMRPEL